MAAEATQRLQPRGNRDMATTAEATRPGLLLVPAVDIFEDPNAITLVADMPGVKREQLTIGLHEGVLTITGHGGSTEGVNEVAILEEYRTGTYQRSFSLSEAIDQSNIHATLKHGLLRLRLPKVQQAKPRQINVQTA